VPYFNLYHICSSDEVTSIFTITVTTLFRKVIEGGSSRSHYVEESFWKRPVVWQITDDIFWFHSIYKHMASSITESSMVVIWASAPSGIWVSRRCRGKKCLHSCTVCTALNVRSKLQ